MSKHTNFSRRALCRTLTHTHLEGRRSVDLSNHPPSFVRARREQGGVFVGIWRLPIGTDIVPHGIVFVKNMKPVS